MRTRGAWRGAFTLEQYLTAWADYLHRDYVELVIAYDAEGPTLDVYVDGRGPGVRWPLGTAR